MKRNRGERETSEVFRKRGHRRVMPKNAWNEKDRDKKKKTEERKSIEPTVYLRCQIYLHREPRAA